jgi:transposase InsO family protein
MEKSNIFEYFKRFYIFLHNILFLERSIFWKFRHFYKYYNLVSKLQYVKPAEWEGQAFNILAEFKPY